MVVWILNNQSLGQRLKRENFEVLWLFAKVFFAKFGGVASCGGTIGGTSEQSAKVFSAKIPIRNSNGFLLYDKYFYIVVNISWHFVSAQATSIFPTLNCSRWGRCVWLGGGWCWRRGETSGESWDQEAPEDTGEGRTKGKERGEGRGPRERGRGECAWW